MSNAELGKQLKEWLTFYKAAQSATERLLSAARDPKKSTQDLSDIFDKHFPCKPDIDGVAGLIMAEKEKTESNKSLDDGAAGAGAGGDDKKEGKEKDPNHFNAHSISVRAQKKLASRLASKKTIKIFIDDTSARVFDNIYKLLKQYTGSRSRAQKLMKNVVKVNMKLGVLYMNDCLNDDEKNLTMEFRDKFLSVAETTIKFHKADYIVDVSPLISLFADCERIVLTIIERHLTEKSRNKIRDTCAFFSDRVFLETIFKPGSPLKEIMRNVTDDIQELLDRGII